MALTLPMAMRVTPEQFWDICQANPEAVLELNAHGILEEMTPTGWQSSRRNASLTEQLRLWWRQTREGAVLTPRRGSVCRMVQFVRLMPPGSLKRDWAWFKSGRF